LVLRGNTLHRHVIARFRTGVVWVPYQGQAQPEAINGPDTGKRL
jgi:hypothetical protein